MIRKRARVHFFRIPYARVGYRWSNGWSASLWSKNLLNKDYFELLTPVAGNSGLYVGQPGDPRTFGITLKGTL